MTRSMNKPQLPEVTTGVESSMAPMYLNIPYSSSAKPFNKNNYNLEKQEAF